MYQHKIKSFSSHLILLLTITHSCLLMRVDLSKHSEGQIKLVMNDVKSTSISLKLGIQGLQESTINLFKYVHLKIRELFQGCNSTKAKQILKNG